ncbi:pilus assembly protein CpaF [Stackebrandtia albiflava]|uniref:Pilus assembly protein CpaF n=1 Tax=Stackebrandtia albiflava TaxID=406432 RepID=A0A562UYU2_9ACTN|nr:TadA family conjugal transfer-associated ATPase [Stackebrandtia albiflava]TWJ10775.1 pilus assembly protein CpaF [Stackebrandtia albiflava]
MTTALLKAVRRQLLSDTRDDVSGGDVAAALHATGRAPVTGPALLGLAGRLTDDLTGAGRLQPLLDTPDVTDVLVNGPGVVWADSGEGLRPTDVCFPDAASVRELAARLATAAGRRLDDAHPFVDVRLPDGTRLHAVLPPLAVAGPYLSLRTHRPVAFDMAGLIQAGTFTPESAQWVARIVARRLPFLVSGGTGSGKTTLLRSLLESVPDGERIVVVEDSPELAPRHPQVVSLRTRQANVDGAGEVNLASLVRQALRMRPDRIVVGECRGAEVIELLAALNTGHDGSAGTVHANTAADVPARLAALALPHGLSRPGLYALIAAALRVVVHMRRIGARRVVSEISLLEVDPDHGRIRVSPAWRITGGATPGRPRLTRLLSAEERPWEPSCLPVARWTGCPRHPSRATGGERRPWRRGRSVTRCAPRRPRRCWRRPP